MMLGLHIGVGGTHAARLIATNDYTSTANLTIASGVTAINFSLQGAGGGAAGANANDVAWFQSPGAGAGGNARGWVEVTAGDTITITIGSGGTGGIGKTAGQSGGTSTLAKNGVVFATCNGGASFSTGGAASITANVINGATQTGEAGTYSGTSFLGGNGGSSPNGTGGIGAYRATGGAATGRGAGGGGTGTNFAENRTGGAGTGGKCRIRSWSKTDFNQELGYSI